MLNDLTRAQYGKAYEHRLIAELLERGHEVALPIVDRGVDLVVNYRLAVQVKATTTHRCDFRYRGHAGAEGHHIRPEIDVVAIWHETTGDWYFISGERARSSLTVHFTSLHDARNAWSLFDAEPDRQVEFSIN